MTNGSGLGSRCGAAQQGVAADQLLRFVLIDLGIAPGRWRPCVAVVVGAEQVVRLRVRLGRCLLVRGYWPVGAGRSRAGVVVGVIPIVRHLVGVIPVVGHLVIGFPTGRQRRHVGLGQLHRAGVVELTI